MDGEPVTALELSKHPVKCRTPDLRLAVDAFHPAKPFQVAVDDQRARATISFGDEHLDVGRVKVIVLTEIDKKLGLDVTRYPVEVSGKTKPCRLNDHPKALVVLEGPADCCGLLIAAIDRHDYRKVLKCLGFERLNRTCDKLFTVKDRNADGDTRRGFHGVVNSRG